MRFGAQFVHPETLPVTCERSHRQAYEKPYSSIHRSAPALLRQLMASSSR